MLRLLIVTYLVLSIAVSRSLLFSLPLPFLYCCYSLCILTYTSSSLSHSSVHLKESLPIFTHLRHLPYIAESPSSGQTSRINVAWSSKSLLPFFRFFPCPVLREAHANFPHTTTPLTPHRCKGRAWSCPCGGSVHIRTRHKEYARVST